MLTGEHVDALAWRDTRERKQTRDLFLRECFNRPTAQTLEKWEGHEIVRTWRNEENHLTPLLFACHQPCEANLVLPFLLRNGADPHQKDALGRGSLALSATGSREHRQGWFQALLDLGLDPNACDKKGRSPMSTVLLSGDRVLFDMLVQAGGKPTAEDLNTASSVNQQDILEGFFECFGPPNTQEERTQWCWRAASMRHWRMVRALLPHGVDLSYTRDGENLVTLTAGQSKPPVELIETLVEAGVDPHHRHPETGRDAVAAALFANRFKPTPGQKTKPGIDVTQAISAGIAKRLERDLAGPAQGTSAPRQRM